MEKEKCPKCDGIDLSDLDIIMLESLVSIIRVCGNEECDWYRELWRKND